MDFFIFKKRIRAGRCYWAVRYRWLGRTIRYRRSCCRIEFVETIWSPSIFHWQTVMAWVYPPTKHCSTPVSEPERNQVYLCFQLNVYTALGPSPESNPPGKYTVTVFVKYTNDDFVICSVHLAVQLENVVNVFNTDNNPTEMDRMIKTESLTRFAWPLGNFYYC